MAVLKMKSKGKEVVDLQKGLNKAISSKLVTDGQFGKLTEAALKKFQKKHSLKPDGVAGTSTLAVMGLGPSIKIAKMKVEDCRKDLSFWKQKDSAQGIGGPDQIAREMVEVKKLIKELEQKFASIAKDAQTIQKDKDKHRETMIATLDEIVKHQRDYEEYVKKMDAESAAAMASGADTLYAHYKKTEKAFDAASGKQSKIFLDRFLPLVSKAFE